MYLIEKEKKQMNTMKASHDAQLNAYSVQVDHLKQLLEQQKINNNNNSSNGQSGDNKIKQGGSTGSDSGVGGTSQKPKMGSTSSSHSYQGSATGIKGQTGVGGFSQSPRSAFSTLSSSASASKVSNLINCRQKAASWDFFVSVGRKTKILNSKK